MRSINKDNNKFSRTKKMSYFTIGFFVLFFIGMISVLAYYGSSYSFPIYANKIGNFGNWNSDLSIIIYKQVNDLGAATPEYERVSAIPSVGYHLNNVDCTTPCSTNTNDDCYYEYDNVNNTYKITSNKSVSCSFYFNKSHEKDFEVVLFAEDEFGSQTYNSKNYRRIEHIPAYGYAYNNYTCLSPANLTYDEVNRIFNISSTTANTCYAYFDKIQDADTFINIYIQEQKGSNVYKKTDYLPINVGYITSTNSENATGCFDKNNVLTSDVITFTGGKVTVTASNDVTCNIYLDIYEGAPLIKGMDASVTSSSITVTGDVTPGINNLNCYKYKIDGVNDLTSCQTSSTYTFNNLKSCTYYKITMFAIDDSGVEVGYTKSFKTGGC